MKKILEIIPKNAKLEKTFEKKIANLGKEESLSNKDMNGLNEIVLIKVLIDL